MTSDSGVVAFVFILKASLMSLLMEDSDAWMVIVAPPPRPESVLISHFK